MCEPQSHSNARCTIGRCINQVLKDKHAIHITHSSKHKLSPPSHSPHIIQVSRWARWGGVAAERQKRCSFESLVGSVKVRKSIEPCNLFAERMQCTKETLTHLASIDCKLSTSCNCWSEQCVCDTVRIIIVSIYIYIRVTL